MLLACRNKEERQQKKKTRVVITAENKRVIKCSLLILCTTKIYFMIKCICKYDKTPFFSKNKKNTKKKHTQRERILTEGGEG